MSYSDEEDDALGCFVCGSNNFHYEEGQQYCENGHLLSQSQVVGEDETKYHFQGRRTRAIRHKGQKQRVAKLYYGKEAFELFLHAFQFILWKQCHDLINIKKFPPQLWTVVLDLWTLRLTKLARRLDGLDGHGEDDSTGHETDESTNVHSDGQDASKVSRRQNIQAGNKPRLEESVALCYLAMVILRLPVRLADLFSWIETGELTYMRAIRHVPEEMRRRMMGNYQQDLDTMYLPKLESMQSSVISLARVYIQEFGLSFPPLNVDPFLYRHIKDLALPLEVFPATKALARLLGYKFTFVSLPGNTNQPLATIYPEAQLASLLCISVKLLFPFDSAYVSRYPHTNNEPAVHTVDWKFWLSQQHDGHDESCDRPGSLGEDAKGPFYTTDADVFKMTPEQLDKYMDWYQETWAKVEIETAAGSSKEIFDMFPLVQIQQPQCTTQADRVTEIATEEEKIAMMKHMQEKSKMRQALPTIEDGTNSEPAVLRPGEHYHMIQWTLGDFEGIETLYPNSRSASEGVMDSQRECPPHQVEKLFLHKVSKVSGISLKDLLLTAKRVEREIVKWLDSKRREEYWQAADKVDEPQAEIGSPEASLSASSA